MEVAIFWVLLLAFAAAFALQIGSRVRLVVAAPNTFSVDRLTTRIRRLIVDVAGQRQTMKERPITGAAHALVFWGFVAFGGYTVIEFLRGLGIADLTGGRWFHLYRLVLTPVAILVLAGIAYLLGRRVFVRPVDLGPTVSTESILIGLFIVILMTTFLLTWRLSEATLAGRVNWWTHALVILIFLALIPASKHFHLVLAPITVFLRSPELGAVPNLDFDKDQVGLEVVKDLGSKTVLDAMTCVECGRCQVNCPAWGAGQALNPKTLVLQTQKALLAGHREATLPGIYSEEVLWQCTTCGACEKQCPVGIEHLPLVIGTRRGLVSNGRAPAYLGGLYSNLERRSNIWGLTYDERQKFVESAGLEYFDPARHDVVIWLGCAGAFEPDFQKSLLALFGILRASGVRFGVLSKESCTGDPAKRTGNEYVFQELAKTNIRHLKEAGAGSVATGSGQELAGKTVLTSCPHCLKTLGADYRRLGYDVPVVHSAVFVERLTRGVEADGSKAETVTYHDPCYLGRYAETVDEPRALLGRFGAEVVEPIRHRDNPYCCGAGGGLLFADKEGEPGTRISDVRLKQLHETGVSTVVTACPFCSIMLKGAQASAPGPNVQFVDLMTYVHGRLTKRPEATRVEST
jgi:Fe-S oxidoreductase